MKIELSVTFPGNQQELDTFIIEDYFPGSIHDPDERMVSVSSRRTNEGFSVNVRDLPNFINALASFVTVNDWGVRQ